MGSEMCIRDRYKQKCTLLDFCVSSLRRGHANLLCTAPLLADGPRRESEHKGSGFPQVFYKAFVRLLRGSYKVVGRVLKEF